MSLTTRRKRVYSNAWAPQTIELRLGSEPVKAKWVRIELRKVETLPGGGQANTFYDHVGQSPLNVWAAREDYDLLQTVSEHTFRS